MRKIEEKIEKIKEIEEFFFFLLLQFLDSQIKWSIKNFKKKQMNKFKFKDNYQKEFSLFNSNCQLG